MLAANSSCKAGIPYFKIRCVDFNTRGQVIGNSVRQRRKRPSDEHDFMPTFEMASHAIDPLREPWERTMRSRVRPLLNKRFVNSGEIVFVCKYRGSPAVP